MTVRVDLNADLGESYGAVVRGDDASMLDIVTSANVACGFHAGDALTLQRTCALAAERGVVIGAQVSYADLEGFGRRSMDIGPDQLFADVIYQIGALEAMCRLAGTRPSETVCIGDNLEWDVLGARSAGLRAVWIDRDGGVHGPAVPPVPTVRSLDELTTVLKKGRFGQPPRDG